MILVDMNAWIQHLRRRDAQLVGLLMSQRVHTCDVVVGELLLGSGLPREFLSDLRALPSLPSADPEETVDFMGRQRRAFAGSGVGWADAQVILTALNSGARIHTSDRGVRKVARALGLSLA